MAIGDLTALVPAPKKANNVGPLDQWQQVCQTVGVALPDDYRDFCMTYGSGAFCNAEIWIKNAFESDYATWFAKGLENADHYHDDCEMPYAAFPKRPGVLPLGGDGLGNTVYYLVPKAGKPWAIVTMQHESEEDAETHKLPLTTFLARVFSRKLECNIWNDDNYFAEDVVLDFQSTM